MLKFCVVCAFGILLVYGCTHNPIVPVIEPTATFKTYTPSCSNCPSEPICPEINDILLNSSTTYTICLPSPNNQGSIVLNSGFCAIWTPNGSQTEIVSTCIVACTNGVCDSTYVTIFPPVPPDTATSGNPCNPEVVYFEKDVLPILTQNCAYSGCHNNISKQDGIILDSYANVINTGKVKAFKLNDSKLYEVITENDAKDIMPPPPSVPLTSEQINIIAKWINQGAKNEQCDIGSQPCNTENIKFSTYIKPLLASCTTCHKTGNTSGGINLDSYTGIKSAATSGKLYGSVARNSGFSPMPLGGSKLPDCTIKKLKSWIDAGSPNN